MLFDMLECLLYSNIIIIQVCTHDTLMTFVISTLKKQFQPFSPPQSCGLVVRWDARNEDVESLQQETLDNFKSFNHFFIFSWSSLSVTMKRSVWPAVMSARVDNVSMTCFCCLAAACWCLNKHKKRCNYLRSSQVCSGQRWLSRQPGGAFCWCGEWCQAWPACKVILKSGARPREWGCTGVLSW